MFLILHELQVRVYLEFEKEFEFGLLNNVGSVEYWASWKWIECIFAL
jgi:hypothetical protein